jgi:hypothetical protein
LLFLASASNGTPSYTRPIKNPKVLEESGVDAALLVSTYLKLYTSGATLLISLSRGFLAHPPKKNSSKTTSSPH